MVSLTEIAEASSSSPPSTTYNHRYKYDVFISFRGFDTRLSFTSHLHTALVKANLTTFLDDEEIPTGEFLKPELESAIKASRASVIVLSENYASSTWCLEELVLILEQKNNSNQIVIPVFYHVEPTHVRKQQSSFGEAMEKHKLKMEAETNVEEKGRLGEKMKRWKDALTQVSNLKGKDAHGRSETTLIEEIVDELYKRLGLPLGTTTFPQLIGMEYHIKRISSWLKDGSKHTADVLTIWGMGGIGKTSLAKYVYELHRHAYTSYSFIEDVSRRCTGTHGLLKLQIQLYGDISKRKLTRVHNVSEYTSIICKALAHEEVLVILDDIDSYDQLDQLLGDKGFHPGSKIIITTKDASLIERCALFKTKGKPKHTVCILEGLSAFDSLKLLCHHAFICNYPREGYEEVVEKLARYCEGHPLALEVLGKSLHKRDVAYWEERIKGLKKEPLSGIDKAKKALQLSFDSLSSENDKELFKHIACFFVGEDRDLTETVLEACDINTTSGITNLMEKCFLCIRWNKLWMHSLIQEMGRDLVRQESLNKPWERSRLWCHEESFDVLKRKKGTENILGLALDTRMLDKKKLRGSFELKTESFSQMSNLMLLQLNNVKLNESFHNFPEELRWLCMHGFPLKAIHLNKPMENLVALDMSNSNIESFDMSYSDPQPPAKKQKLVGSCSKDKPLLGSLKILNLSFCYQLHSVGGFFELPALEKLIVTNCKSLMEVCESVEQCVELVHIDLSYCYKLKKLPISLGNLQKVQTLLLDGCKLSESANMDSSDVSISSQTSSSAIIREAIPSDFKFFMTFLPSSLRILSLAYNNLSNDSFPMDLSCLAMLEELCLDNNPIVSLPNCVGTLPRIQKLSMDFCDDVISVEHLPHTLREFSMLTEDEDAKIRKIKFDPELPPLKLGGIPWVALNSPVEIEGIIKIEPMADVEEKLLHSLGWKKSDFIKGHLLTHDDDDDDLLTHDIQMFYEFGIFSTFYEGKGMPEWIRCRGWGPLISFIIPSSPKKLRGLNLCCVNWPPFTNDYFSMPRIKISNITKKQTWSYIHYCARIRVDGKDCFSWLSHWMFGPNEMKAGDNIIIECDRCEEEYKMKCGVGVVYDDGSMEEEEDVLSYYKSWNHIIGGDLSPFQLTTGEYYLRNWEFQRDSHEALDLPLSFKSNFKEKEVMFKAFSTKKSEIVGSQAQCSQTRPTEMPPAEAPCMPMFPQDLGQQTFDGQALVPAMSSDGGPMANFYMPMVPTCQQQPCPGGSRAGVSGPQNHQPPLSLMQQQMEPYGLMYPHPPGSDTGNVSMGSVPYDGLNAGGIFALTNASPTEQRTAQYSQMGPTRAAPAGASCMPTFLPGLGQQLFYGQAQPTFIPPQPGFGHRYQLVPGQHGPRPGGSHVGFHGQQIQQQPILLRQQQHQHQLVPGMSPNGSPMPNFYMPMLQPGQHGPRSGGSLVGVPGQQIQQQPVLMQQQMAPYGPMSHHMPGSYIADVSMSSYPYDAGNVMQLSDAGGSSALANAFPTEQRNMLGEPLAEQRFFSGRNYHEH